MAQMNYDKHARVNTALHLLTQKLELSLMYISTINKPHSVWKEDCK